MNKIQKISTIKKKMGKFSNTLIGGFTNFDNATKIEAQKGERFFEQNFKSLNNTDPLTLFAKTTLIRKRIFLSLMTKTVKTSSPIIKTANHSFKA